jgi:hypothetical protein
MAKYGYQIDKGLSNDNQQVYYNPESKKLLYNVTGSHIIELTGSMSMQTGFGRNNRQRHQSHRETLRAWD